MEKKNNYKNQGFEIPDGYFENSSDQLFQKLNFKSIHKSGPFTTPDSYFDELEDRVVSRGDFSSQQDLLKDKNFFKVPSGYFDELTHKILDVVNENQNQDNHHGFTVPNDYFKQSERKLIENATDKPVVTLKPEYPSWVVPMLAVAAMIVAIMAIDGFWTTDMPSIQDLENEELAIYLAETDFSTDEESLEILYSGTGVLDQSHITNTVSSDALLDYLAEEVEMNQMIEQ